ncbi:MAG TPA: AAA family ATPase [Brumimicrobium sp.]|nr:AAA family ATPase [Brumimicrobium sp.]
MKILKIELQNLNSLKSDTPTVIDFESNQFNDVGLYAITGSTGAGKTTILDAITIALYNNVPRFNNSTGKLIDVVSHGAGEAHSRVTFENNHVIYEAFWGIRLVNRNGEALKTPQEEVSLKNLTSGVTLADQKRHFQEEIVRVTQLDYQQFLRSVMLAQGEFASFLTAKGPEKGRLLEQITGEEIYKKIGQAILDRRSSEEKKLNEIKGKINAEDILSEERKIELTSLDKAIDDEVAGLSKKSKSIEVIVNWYLKHKELTEEAFKIGEESKALDFTIEQYKEEFKLLNLNEKAEPFKELIQNFNRNEKSSAEKVEQLKALEAELTQLKPEIERLAEVSKNQGEEQVKASSDFKDWLPKFDTITQLDGQLKAEAVNKEKAQTKRNELSKEVTSLTKEKDDLLLEVKSLKTKIQNDEVFLKENMFLEKVDAERSNWTSKLTSLKSNKEALNEGNDFISKKKIEVENTNTEQIENDKLLSKSLDALSAIEKETVALNLKLAQNNLSKLIPEKDKLSKAETNWKQFKSYAEQQEKEEKELTVALVQKESFSTELKVVKNQLEKKVEEIAKQEESVADQHKILDLEKSISKYEDDRQNLVEGQPCGLCGSTEHPFTAHLDSKGVSEAEIELKKRTVTLETLKTNKSHLEKHETVLNTTIDGLIKRIIALEADLKDIQSKAKELGIECDLSNTAKINIEINEVAIQLAALEKEIETAHQLQIEKEALANSTKTKGEVAETLKTKKATLSEKDKNLKAEINDKKQSILNLTKTCSDLENDLSTRLAKFNYTLPTVEEIHSFIQKIEEDVTNFNKAQKNLEELKSEIKLKNNNIKNLEKQLEGTTKTQTEYTNAIQKSNEIVEKVKAERIVILPLEIGVDEKRASLQAVINQLTEKVELSRKQLQEKLDEKNKKETLKLDYENVQKALVKELEELNIQLKAELETSDFESKEAIENALLSNEDKAKFSQKKKTIEEKQSRLKTLQEVNIKSFENLNATKNFELSEEESQLTLQEIEVKMKEVLARKGEIKEAFRKDQEIRDRNAGIYKEIEAQDKIYTIWRELFKLIGNSKEAFNTYVQRLTLKHLLDLANVHLYNLNKRYSLKMDGDYKAGEELSFNLIDHYQTDQARKVETSSGGEKFIISLALALGLSDLASKNVKIDSLFIDEGFGTLDTNTLETVIATLETLQSQGKMIGIISHVENLKDRIPTQIVISKKSNGVSEVNFAG